MRRVLFCFFAFVCSCTCSPSSSVSAVKPEELALALPRAKTCTAQLERSLGRVDGLLEKLTPEGADDKIVAAMKQESFLNWVRCISACYPLGEILKKDCLQSLEGLNQIRNEINVVRAPVPADTLKKWRETLAKSRPAFVEAFTRSAKAAGIKEGLEALQ